MADNVTIPATGSGTATPVIATDDVGGIQYQQIKIDGGGDGVAVPIIAGQQAMAASLPVVIASNQTAVPISAASLPLPTGASTAANQPGLGTAGTANANVLSVQGIASMTPVQVSQATGTNLHAVLDSGTLTTVSTVTAVTAITNALPAGAAILGKVGIDQTTPGTTNGVQVNAALPAGANVIGALTANQSVNLAQVNAATVNVGAGNAGAGTPRVSIATDDVNLAAINAVSGTTAGAAVITDANGTLQQYLRGIVKLLIASGTIILGAGANLIGYTGRKFTVGNIATLTTTNFSGLTSGSGWQSAAISPAGASDIIFSLTTLGAAGSTLLADFYIAETNGTSYTDGATGSEGTFTAANRKNSRYLGSLQLNTTNSVVGELRLSDVMLTPNSSIALIGINNSGGTISATGGNTVFTYQLVY